MDMIVEAVHIILGTTIDVVPVAAFLFFFHGAVLRRKLVRPGRILAGFGLVVLGLGLFLIGLETGLFPLGRTMAEQLTSISIGQSPIVGGHWSDYYWVYAFAFAVGFGTTVAEPALLAVGLKAQEVSGGAIHSGGLRVAVALGVAVGVALGCFRIVTGTPLHLYIIAGYAVVVVQTVFSPRLIIPLAYDSGGVTTSTVTVPLVTALGLGLAEHVPGRNSLLDGFGLIAFASLFPIISVLAYAQLTALRERRNQKGGSNGHIKGSIEPRLED
jgi:hypothetical protein